MSWALGKKHFQRSVLRQNTSYRSDWHWVAIRTRGRGWGGGWSSYGGENAPIHKRIDDDTLLENNVFTRIIYPKKKIEEKANMQRTVSKCDPS